MPTTSKRSASSAPSTPAAVRQETPCSLLVPPKTTATRCRRAAIGQPEEVASFSAHPPTLPGSRPAHPGPTRKTGGHDLRPQRPGPRRPGPRRLGHAPPRDPRRHRRPAGAGRRRPAQPARRLRLHLRRHATDRSGRAGLRPLRQPDLAGPGGGDRRPRGRPGPDLRLRDGRRARRPRAAAARRTVVLPGNCYLGVAAPSPSGPPAGLVVRPVDVADTEEVVARPTAPTWCGWSRRPTRPSRWPTCPRWGRAGRTADHATVVDNTFATPLLQQPLSQRRGHRAALGDQVHRRALRRAARGAGRRPTTTNGSPRWTAHAAARRHPRHDGGLLVLRGLRTLPLRLARPRPTPPSWPNGWPPTRRSAGSAIPGWPTTRSRGGRADDGRLRVADVDRARRRARGRAVVDGRRLWVFATSLGGVESTFERRRRWPGELPTVPEGLVRLSVGIEHVEDLWADLVQALDAARAEP